MSATFAKLNSGAWGIRVQGPVAVGDRVLVTKKNNTTSLQTVVRVVWTGNGASLCEIAQSARAASSPVPRRSSCSSCSCMDDCCRNGCRCHGDCNCKGGQVYDC